MTLGDLLTGIEVDPAKRSLVEALRAFVVATVGKGSAAEAQGRVGGRPDDAGAASCRVVCMWSDVPRTFAQSTRRLASRRDGGSRTPWAFLA
jgi:hypothetical protein